MRIESTAVTVNRLCGSGFESVICGAREMMAGEAPNGLVLASGAESMSQAPLSVYGQNVRFGHRLGTDLGMVDTLWTALTDSYCKTPMGVTAENLAAKYGLTRAECDAFALRSQKMWAAANAAGHLRHEIAPVEGLKGKKGPETMGVDEHPRPESTPESMAKLPTVFKKDGVVTAAGSSGICDGAASLILASEEAVSKHGLKPLARIAGWAITGVDPSIMGIGPAPAIRQVLARAGKKLSDMDVLEVNEAFAAQALAVAKDLELPVDRLNTEGGAIALGHPLGASGARITAHVAHMLASSGGKKKYGIGSACIGGGQGIAILLEAV
jgi:acetyl-CoA acyltransferase 2